MKKRISLTFDLGQVCNDILVKCNLISQTIQDAALEDIRANVQSPDDAEIRSIINRSVTEAFGRVKVACQRYLLVGRDTDDNKLERLVQSVTYKQEVRTVQDEDDDGHKLYNVTVGSATVVAYKNSQDQWVDSQGSLVRPDPNTTPAPKMVTKTVDSDEIDEIVYEEVSLTLEIPNFNLSVTDHLKSSIHKYVVDYTMGRFLQDQVADKAKEYKDLADTEDLAAIISDLNARERYTMRKPTFM